MGQNERNAKSGTSIESCSLLLQTSFHFTTDIFSRKLGTAGEKISENLSTLLSESAPGFVPMFFSFTLQRTKICRLLSMPVRKFFLREPVSAQVIFKTLRGDRACKNSAAGRGCRSRQAAYSRVWGRLLPTRFRWDRMSEMRNLAPR